MHGRGKEGGGKGEREGGSEGGKEGGREESRERGRLRERQGRRIQGPSNETGPADERFIPTQQSIASSDEPPFIAI